MMSKDVVNRYLDRVGSTLWGRSFDIIGNREEAVRFITNLYDDLTLCEFELDTRDDDWGFSPDGKVPYA